MWLTRNTPFESFAEAPGEARHAAMLFEFCSGLSPGARFWQFSAACAGSQAIKAIAIDPHAILTFSISCPSHRQVQHTLSFP